MAVYLQTRGIKPVSDPPTTELTFAGLLEMDAIRYENHCDRLCAYEDGCTCWQELKATMEAVTHDRA